MEYEALHVGIDVSKLKHDVAIMNEHKKLVHKPFQIKDERAGYQYLIGKIEQLAEKYQTNTFYFGLEATSDYWKNIYYFLKSQPQNFSVTAINPVRTKNFAKTELRRAKTDPIDAKDIALFMVEKQPAASADRLPIFDSIKDLDRQIHAIKKQQTMIVNRLRLELTKVAPEIEKAIANLKGQQTLALLANFPTAEDIANASLKELSEVRYGKNDWTLPMNFINKIKSLAKNSIAYKTGPGAGYVVQSLVKLILQAQHEIDYLKEQIKNLYQIVNDYESILTTIPGIGRETAIVLEAYIGDVNRFPNARKFVAYFGMNPTVNKSGKSKRKSRLQKKGSGIVRQKLFMAIFSIISRRKGFIYAYYKRLVDSGKPKLVAICAAMRKLLAIIYAMLKNQEPFDPNRI